MGAGLVLRRPSSFCGSFARLVSREFECATRANMYDVRRIGDCSVSPSLSSREQYTWCTFAPFRRVAHKSFGAVPFISWEDASIHSLSARRFKRTPASIQGENLRQSLQHKKCPRDGARPSAHVSVPSEAALGAVSDGQRRRIVVSQSSRNSALMFSTLTLDRLDRTTDRAALRGQGARLTRTCHHPRGGSRGPSRGEGRDKGAAEKSRGVIAIVGSLREVSLRVESGWIHHHAFRPPDDGHQRSL